MKGVFLRSALFYVCIVGLAACAHGDRESGWSSLIQNGQGIENFEQVGSANWKVVDNALQATQGGKEPAYLVSRTSYENFSVRVEFWASEDANSGIFVRCQDPKKITDESCYEANIFDQRPDPTFGTGAIVKITKAPDPMPKVGGRWNVYEFSAVGSKLVLVLNGVKTAEVEDSKFKGGPIALQWGRGSIRFRNVEIKRL